jgi:hypothetical protein
MIRDFPTPVYRQYPHNFPISGLDEKWAFSVDKMWMDFSRFFPQGELVPITGADPTSREKREMHPIYGYQVGLSTISTSPTAITILISYL